jgi:hypothetical protein
MKTASPNFEKFLAVLKGGKLEGWKVENGRLTMGRGRYNMHDAGCRIDGG